MSSPAPSTPQPVHRDEVLAELNRLLATPVFSSATRSAALLRFLVIEALEGRAERLKEYVLGVEALGRADSFDPRIDPIARVEASRLRTKLELCYGGNEPADGIKIRLARGTYVPEFQRTAQPSPTVRENRGLKAASILLGMVGALLAGLAIPFLFQRDHPKEETIRLSVLPPVDSIMQSVAVSADARRLVIAASTHSTPHLYLRSLSASFDAHLITGTDGAEFPFWSPDGRFIGFFADRKLKIIDVNGGEPRTLTDVPLGRGAVWTNDGDIIYASGALGALQHIAATGGKTAPFLSLEVSRGEIAQLWPSLLPDGSRVAYLSANQDHSQDAILAVDGRKPDRRVKLAAALSSMGFTSGENEKWRMYFLRDGALVEQELNRETLAALGEPATVALQLDFDPLTRYCFLSVARNGFLAYVPGTPFRYRLAWLNRSGGEISTLAEPSDYYALKMSPDGRQVLANQTDARFGDTSVSKVDLVRGTVSRLTSGSVNFLPIWSADGTQVAFARSVAAEKGMRLCVLPENGGTPRSLLEVHGPIFPSDWSADGKLIAYTGFGPLAKLSVVSVLGPKPSEIWSYSVFPRSAGGGVFSPGNGHRPPQWIAYTSDGSDRDEVYVQSFPDGKKKLQVSASGGRGPSWRRDGRELFYIDGDDDLVAVERSTTNDLSFGAPHKLFHMPTQPLTAPPFGLNYAASSDGQRFVVRVRDSRGEGSSIRIISHWSREDRN